MKKITIFTFLIVVACLVLLLILNYITPSGTLLSPLSKETPRPTPLTGYTFENLKQMQFNSSPITLGAKTGENDNSISQMFYYNVPKKPMELPTEKVSGLINIPKNPGVYPVIIMFRGFAPSEGYFSGIGTQPSAQVFAKEGFITLAPDFLGFGESASASGEAFENRFQTYVTALSLLSSVKTLNIALEEGNNGVKADLSKIGIWGHSNGGQIAISVLEISGVIYPTVIWAPVTKSFPYSVLYYTDEADDQGKILRRLLSEFEKDYDTEKYSLTNYINWINAPLEIHQGTADEEVPVWWSDEFVSNIKKADKEINYYTYPGADHNLRPNGWNPAVSESVNFFKSRLSQ